MLDEVTPPCGGPVIAVTIRLSRPYSLVSVVMMCHPSCPTLSDPVRRRPTWSDPVHLGLTSSNFAWPLWTLPPRLKTFLVQVLRKTAFLHKSAALAFHLAPEQVAGLVRGAEQGICRRLRVCFPDKVRQVRQTRQPHTTRWRWRQILDAIMLQALAHNKGLPGIFRPDAQPVLQQITLKVMDQFIVQAG